MLLAISRRFTLSPFIVFICYAIFCSWFFSFFRRSSWSLFTAINVGSCRRVKTSPSSSLHALISYARSVILIVSFSRLLYISSYLLPIFSVQSLSPQQPLTCLVCKVHAQFIEINRNLRPEMKIYFQNPRDVAAQYFKNLTSVIDFQDKQRARFATVQQERVCFCFIHLPLLAIPFQFNKAVKYAKECQAQAKKHAVNEK